MSDEVMSNIPIGLPAELPGSELMRRYAKQLSPDDIAIAAMQGLLAQGFPPDTVSGHAYRIILPAFLLEANNYWYAVQQAGSITPLLAPFVMETASSDQTTGEE